MAKTDQRPHERPRTAPRLRVNVRTVCSLVALPGLLVADGMVLLHPHWTDFGLVAANLLIIALATVPDCAPRWIRSLLVVLGAVSLGLGQLHAFDVRNAYTMAYFVLVLMAAGYMEGRIPVMATATVTGAIYVWSRHLLFASVEGEYAVTTMATDMLSVMLMAYLVFSLAEGQRQIKKLHALLQDRSWQAENELQRTLEASRDIVMTATLEGDILSISPVCQEILGYAPDEMIGRKSMAFLHPDDLARTMQKRDEVAGGTPIAGLENRYLHKNGRIVWLEWIARWDDAEGVLRCVARDISERKEADRRLLESEQRYRALYNCNPDIILVSTPESGMLAGNPAFGRVTGFDPELLVAQDRADRLNLLFQDLPADRERWFRGLEIAASGQTHTVELTICHRAGHRLTVEATFIPMVVEQQNQGVYVVAKDVTQRKEAQVAQARLAAVLEATTDFVTQTAPDGRGMYLNRAARFITGTNLPEAWKLNDLYTPKSLAFIRKVAIPTALRLGSWSGEAVWRSASGADVPVSQVILAHKAPDGTVEYLSTMARDISERKRFEAELAHLASHDMLTGLLNRRGFAEAMAAGLDGKPGALLYLDLDEFKYVNDSLGHRAGDGLLRNLAELLQSLAQPGDILSRISGDEFIMMLPGRNRSGAQTAAERVLEALRRQPVEAAGQQISITASIGIALYPEHGATLEELLAHADQAMYQAKGKGRNILSVYEQDDVWTSQVEYRMSWERRIRQALEGNGFVLYAQPILDLVTGQISRYELLLRMADGSGGLIPPATFLDVAERFGLIHQIDRWVVRQAIALVARHELEGRDLFLEVNLSGKALNDPELLSLIRRDLAAAGIAPHRLVFEITETAAIGDVEAALDFINVLKCLGCRFALDDFGAGFSSFERLKRLPVDYLKLDGSFIRDLPNDEEDRHLVKAMVEVARGLGKETIAEFVEDAETVAILRESGVDYAQGYHVGRPRPVTEIWPASMEEVAAG